MSQVLFLLLWTGFRMPRKLKGSMINKQEPSDCRMPTTTKNSRRRTKPTNEISSGHLPTNHSEMHDDTRQGVAAAANSRSETPSPKSTLHTLGFRPTRTSTVASVVDERTPPFRLASDHQSGREMCKSEHPRKRGATNNQHTHPFVSFRIDSFHHNSVFYLEQASPVPL